VFAFVSRPLHCPFPSALHSRAESHSCGAWWHEMFYRSDGARRCAFIEISETTLSFLNGRGNSKAMERMNNARGELRRALRSLGVIGDRGDQSEDQSGPTLADLKAEYAERATEEQAVALRHTGRTRLFDKPLRELCLACGRRAGKSRICSLVAVYIATVVDHSTSLVPGEQGIVLLVALSQRQARVLLGYVVAFPRAVPALASMIMRETEFAVELSNNITIEVRSSNFKHARGFTIITAIVDEIAFLPSEDSAIPDTELLNALRPAMASIRGSLLICSSTPHAQAGELHRAHGKFFANDESPDIAFFNASTLTANSVLDARVVEQAFEDDAVVAASEFGSDGFVAFRQDVEAFILQEALEACVNGNRPLILPPLEVAAA